MSALTSRGDETDPLDHASLEPFNQINGVTMSEAEKAAVTVCRDDIIRDVQVIHIIDFLMKYKVINEQEKKHIFDTGIQIILETRDYKRRQEVMREQAKSLLDVLDNKNAFKYFTAALEYNGSYPWIAEKLLAYKEKYSRPRAYDKMVAKFLTNTVAK